MKLFIAKSISILALCGMAYMGATPVWQLATAQATSIYDRAVGSLTRVEVIKEYVQPVELSTDEMIERISIAMSINPTITKAIARQESGLSYRADALRFEPHLEARFAKMARGAEERRMLATSIGVMQVIPGFHMKTCNLTSYAQLFDKRINITCGLQVLKSCLEYNSKIDSTALRFRRAFICYNGSEAYADDIFNHIGQIVLEEGIQ